MTKQNAPQPGSSADPRAPSFAIRSETLYAVFHPVEGGRMGRLRHVHYGDLLVPFTAASCDLSAWPKSGAFPLFPFHNKLRNSTFQHNGHQIRLRPNMPDGTGVMHGPAHRRVWHVSDQAARHIELTLDYKASADWPFDFRATQRFELHRNRLTLALCLTNTGQEVMPGGIGWHPYFQASEDGEIGLRAERQWDPFGQSAPSKLIRDGTVAPLTRLEPGNTQHYSGWKQASALIGDGARITLEGHGGLTCLTALHKECYLCLEPVSHVAGALETMGDPKAGAGLRRLAPGECIGGTAILTVSGPGTE